MIDTVIYKDVVTKIGTVHNRLFEHRNQIEKKKYIYGIDKT
jgi:hypothetical protein